MIQTEAERRRREAGVKQSMEIRVRSGGYHANAFPLVRPLRCLTQSDDVLGAWNFIGFPQFDFFQSKGHAIIFWLAW